MRTYIILKGSAMNVRTSAQMRAIETVLKFLEMTKGIRYFSGKHTFVVGFEEGDQGGNPQWLIANCIGEGAIVGSTGSNDSEKRARKCADMYEDRRDGKDYVGDLILRTYLDHFLMNYDVLEE